MGIQSYQHKGLIVLAALLCIAILVVSGCTRGGADDLTSAADVNGDGVTVVLCYGDSNTWGYVPGSTHERYAYEQRWTTILQESLGEDYSIIPEGLNGRTTVFDPGDASWKNGLNYLTPCLSTWSPVDVLVIMLGTNDCSTELNLDAAQITEGMAQLVDTARSTAQRLQDVQPTIIIVAPAQIREECTQGIFGYKFDANSVQTSCELASHYEQLAKQKSCFFVDASSLEVAAIDGVHLTVSAHEQLASLLAQRIAELETD